jgi:hypothetical protein
VKAAKAYQCIASRNKTEETTKTSIEGKHSQFVQLQSAQWTL